MSRTEALAGDAEGRHREVMLGVTSSGALGGNADPQELWEEMLSAVSSGAHGGDAEGHPIKSFGR